MPSYTEDKRLMVIHSNSGMSSVIDEILFCDDVANLKANEAAITASATPKLILQDCKMVSGSYLLICSDIHEGQILQGVPVVVATSYGSKSADAAKSQDMNRMASMISNLISVFGFTYLVMNKPARTRSAS
ncbi:MAG TPA: hypothetical protein VIM89_17100 [Mucilaginibacter sp.]